MGDMRDLWLPKWAVVILTAAIYLPLVVDQAFAGTGLGLAAERLGLVGGGNPLLFPLWGWLVGKVGRDLAALAWISVGAAILDAVFVALVVGDVFAFAAHLARRVRGAALPVAAGAFRLTELVGTLLAVLAFVFAPGLLAAATRVGPLTTMLLPPLAATALAMRFWRSRPALLAAAALVAYSVWEAFVARRLIVREMLPALVPWLAVGVMPALVAAEGVRRRWLAGRRAQVLTFGAWGLAVAVMATASFASGILNRGRTECRLVARVIDGARSAGGAAVAGEGPLDDLFAFMLPKGMRLVQLRREHDPAYRRELAKWVRERMNSSVVFDLTFAEGLEPQDLMDEWSRRDKAGFEASVVTPPSYFSTRKRWETACAEAMAALRDSAYPRYLRRLLGFCGNFIGCQLIESDLQESAWAVFRAITAKVDPENISALLNQVGMEARGFPAPKEELDEVRKRLRTVDEQTKADGASRRAALVDGRVYVDPDTRRKYEQPQGGRICRNPTDERKVFIRTTAAAPERGRDWFADLFLDCRVNASRFVSKRDGREAQESIRTALQDGTARLATIGPQLVVIDIAIGDMEALERDANDLLRVNHLNPVANVALGTICCQRGDYEKAGYYLKRAIDTGEAPVAAKDAYAWALMRLGRLDEAETFAREAASAIGDSWSLNETLAAVLLREGKTDEGGRVLAKAEALAKAAGIREDSRSHLLTSRAIWLKATGEREKCEALRRRLLRRTDLSAAERAEVEGL